MGALAAEGAAAVFAARFIARHAGDWLLRGIRNRRRQSELIALYEEETQKLLKEVALLGHGERSPKVRDLRALVASETQVEAFVAAGAAADLDALASEVTVGLEPALRRFQLQVLRRSFEALPVGHREVGQTLVTLLEERAMQAPLRLERELAPEPNDERSSDDGRVLELLSARRPLTKLIGRDDELRALRKWVDSEKFVSARLITGAGGAGKTRLAQVLADELHAKRWAAGFLTHDDLERVLAGEAPRLEAWSRRTLLIVDYASAAHERVHELLRRLAAHPRVAQGNAGVSPDEPPMRVLLLDRPGAEAWWDRIAGTYASDELGVRRVTVPAPMVIGGVSEPEYRREILVDFSRRVGAHVRVPAEGDDERFDALLRDARCGEPLFLMMAVLASPTDGGAVVLDASRAELASELAKRERERIARFAPGGIEDARGRMLVHLAAFSTLVRGLGGDAALSAVAAECEIAGFEPNEGPRSLVDQLEEALPAVGLPSAGEAATGVIVPDVVGEAFVLVQLGRSVPIDQRGAVSRAAAVDPVAVLFSLIRIGQDFASPTETRPIDWLSDLALDDSVPLEMVAATLDAVLSEVGHETVELRPSVVDVTEKLIVAARRRLETSRVLADRATLASLLSNIGVHLGALGEREEALQSAEEALDIYREFAAARPDAFRPSLATSLNNVAIGLSELGRPEQALQRAEEALDIRRELAAARPDAFRPDLASSLNNVAIGLSELGRREEALEIYRELAAARPDAFRPDLAASLNVLSNRLSQLGRREQALQRAEEALEISRQLAAARPDAFRPSLAASLNNLAIRLSELGRPEQALRRAEEALEIYRELAAARPDVSRPDLASSLNTLSNLLSELGRREHALKRAEEALEIYRELTAARPDVFRTNLASSLDNLAIRLSELGRREEALHTMREWVALVAEATETDSEPVADALAGALGEVVSGEDDAAVLPAIRRALLVQRAIEYPLGLRAVWGYAERYLLRLEHPAEAALALQASLAALAEGEDADGFTVSLRAQAIAFGQIGESAAYLVATKMLEERDALEGLPDVESLLSHIEAGEERREVRTMLEDPAELEGTLARVLERLREQVPDFEDRLLADDPSLFANGREAESE